MELEPLPRRERRKQQPKRRSKPPKWPEHRRRRDVGRDTKTNLRQEGDEIEFFRSLQDGWRGLERRLEYMLTNFGEDRSIPRERTYPPLSLSYEEYLRQRYPPEPEVVYVSWRRAVWVGRLSLAHDRSRIVDVGWVYRVKLVHRQR
jgi:hypothetical protein